MVWIAPVAALVYIVVSLAIGDWFPFSRYSMYASIGARDHGAAPYCKADGEFTTVDRLEHFGGFDVANIYPKGIPCSLEWQVHEARRWIEAHTAPPDGAPGDVDMEFGFRLIWVDDKGHITEKLRPTLRGTARRRTGRR